MLKRYSMAAIILLILSVMAGCQNVPSYDGSLNASADQTQQLLKNARNSSGAKRAEWLLLASESLLIQKRTDKALAVLNTINRQDLSLDLYQFYYLLMALMVNAVITFVITLAIIYFAFVVPMNRWRERQEAADAVEAAGPSAQELLLTEIRDLLAAERRSTS